MIYIRQLDFFIIVSCYDNKVFPFYYYSNIVNAIDRVTAYTIGNETLIFRINMDLSS